MKYNFETLTSYELIQEQFLSDIDAVGYLLRHKKTGAVITGILNDDDNKVFTIGFRTPPKDSTGVAHILEHSVLCGSKHFPIKDPFIELEKGSLKTFLNAMTYPDRTIYPVASYNNQDFRNLMHVYLDAVFFPLIYEREEIFKQEGWSYDLKELDQDLGYNGVVFNEMKGALSSPEAQLERGILASLYPDTPYAFEYGGDPREIPKLSYEDFLSFHKNYYHPANAWIYLYGDMNLVDELEWIDQNYLSKFDFQKINSSIPLQKSFTKPHIVKLPYGIGEQDSLEEKTYLSLNWSIENNQEIDIILGFEILLEVLVNSNSAVLKRRLMEEGLGLEVSGQFESFLFQPFFGITLRGSEESSLPKMEHIVRETLMEVVRDGIDISLAESVLSLHEFQYKEAEYWNNLKGLFYGLSVFDTWIYHKGNPFANLEKQVYIDKLKTKIHEGFLEELIQTYLLDNRHQSQVILYPVQGLAQKLEDEERKILNQFQESLTHKDKEKFVIETKELETYKNTPSTIEELGVLPILDLSDISLEARKLPVQEVVKGKILWENVSTKGIYYLSLLYDVSHIRQEELVYLSLLQYLLGSLDTKKHSYETLEILTNQHTGGIHHSLLSGLGNKGDFYYLKFDFKCLESEFHKAWSLVKEIMDDTIFENEEKIFEIISMMKVYYQEKLTSSGHTSAVNKAFSYDDVGGFKEFTEGVYFYQFLIGVCQDFDKIKEEIKSKLKKVLNDINERVPLLNITSDPKGLEIVQKSFEQWIVNKHEERLPKGFSFQRTIKKEAVQIPSQVQYVAKVGDYSKDQLPYHGSLRVLSTILGTDYLWNQVRVLGGAYGCMCGFGRFGKSYFVSYRDPHLKRTIEVYDKVIDWVSSFDVDQRELNKFIIGTISQMDMPLSNKGLGNASLLNYLLGISDKDRNKERKEVLMTSVEDIRKTKDYLVSILNQDRLCVFGRENKIQDNHLLFTEIISLNEGKKG